MIRVLHLTRDFPPRHCGGISTAVGGLVAAQVRTGLSVSVISFDAWRPRRARLAAPTPGRAEHQSGVAVLRVSSAADLAAAADFGRTQRPSIVHTHDGMVEPLAAELRGGDAHLVTTVHVLHRQQNDLRGMAERTLSLAAQERALRNADRVIAPSRAAAAALLASYPALDAKLRVAGHGIDDSPGARAAAARHRDAPSEGPLLAVGRFADIKGTGELFEALRLILGRLPEAEVLVAGGVPANARAERRWMARWREETPFDCQDRVRFLGWLEPAGLARCYGEAAAVLIPSRSETFGLVALEGMLHGLPVAATDAGGLPELVEHGRTGLLSSVGDAGALAGHAVALLSDPALARRLSVAASSRARETHLWDHALAHVIDVYASMETTSCR